MIVALMLLVLLTVGAMGMSKNAMRELAISGTTRQGAMARNVADSGIEWAVYWLDVENSRSAADTALGMANLKAKLGQNGSLAGRAYNPLDLQLYPTTRPTPPTDLTFGSVSGTTQGVSVALTRMGKVTTDGMSQGTSQGSYKPAGGEGSRGKQSLPDLWALRSDSQITVGSGLLATKFFHSKEAWISTPPDK